MNIFGVNDKSNLTNQKAYEVVKHTPPTNVKCSACGGMGMVDRGPGPKYSAMSMLPCPACGGKGFR